MARIGRDHDETSATRGKADAEAIREAVIRPTMRLLAFKSLEQQVARMLRKTRDLLVRQQTMLSGVPLVWPDATIPASCLPPAGDSRCDNFSSCRCAPPG